MDFTQLLSLNRVGKFVVVFVNFCPDAIEGFRDLDFRVGFAFLVFVLSRTGLSGKETDGSAKPHRQ